MSRPRSWHLRTPLPWFYENLHLFQECHRISLPPYRGHPQLRKDGKLQRAIVAIYSTIYGHPPVGKLIRHCPTLECVNPFHYSIAGEEEETTPPPTTSITYEDMEEVVEYVIQSSSPATYEELRALIPEEDIPTPILKAICGKTARKLMP